MTAAVSTNRLAARVVALRTELPARTRDPLTPGRYELMQMLGLIGADGQIVPDHTGELSANMSTLDDYPTRFRPPVQEPRSRDCVPPGLANLPPQKPSPRPAPKRRPSGEARCGSFAGRSHHFRRGEPLCAACKDFANEYQKRRRARIRAAKEAAGETPDRKGPATRQRGDRSQEWRKVNPDLPPRPETCGSLAGRSNHLRRGEPLCAKCTVAWNQWQKDERVRRKARNAAEGRTA